MLGVQIEKYDVCDEVNEGEVVVSSHEREICAEDCCYAGFGQIEI